MAVNERFDFTGRSVIVTGGGKGIGKVYVEEFAKAGARVVAAGVPIRRPLATVGGRGSFGTAFLFTVMCALPNAASASLPVMFLSIRSSRNR